MEDLYPSASPKNLNNLLNYDDYNVADSLTDSELQALQVDQSLTLTGFTPEAFFYAVGDAFGKLPKDQFGYELHGNKISLTFNGVPAFVFLLAIFSAVQTKLVGLRIEGIHEVIFCAGKADEIVHQNVSSFLQPNQSSIPLILQEVQEHHLSKSRGAEA